uniref:Uncharacterized protein n=1 Tax=Paulinella longichromatophora TaxID=1708747 RepID=A0A2H4ZQL0_9EUKA|nr:hypothetical protein PLO_846 [Paulinella longichromatophora]
MAKSWFEPNFKREYFLLDTDGGDDEFDFSADNLLFQYINAQSPAILQMIANQSSIYIKAVIRQNIYAMLGALPEGPFSAHYQMTHEHLIYLIGSLKMTGYYLRILETQMEKEMHGYENNDMKSSANESDI